MIGPAERYWGGIIFKRMLVWACSCHGKERFDTQVRANAVARRMTTNHREELQAYHCTFCLGYHIGRPRAKRAGREAA